MAAFFARAGTDIDHIVAGRNHAHVVFDDNHGVARFDQTVQLRDKLFDVGRMQAGGWLVENIQRVAALDPLQLGGEFDALGLTTGKLRGGLAEAQIAQADFAQDTERTMAALRRRIPRPHPPSCRVPRRCLLFVLDLESFGVVASAMTGGARGVDARQEQQLDKYEPLALAGFAAASGDVERKRPAP